MDLCLAAEMAAIDRKALDDFGLTPRLLMENAGAAVARAVHESVPPGGDKTALVLVGGGHNGGDGLVAARHLDALGYPVQVALAVARESLRGATAENLAVIDAMGLTVLDLLQDPESVRGAVRACGIIIDALLGTGLRGAAREPVASLIGWVNVSRKPVIAVDVPSGVIADTGQALGEAVQAATTVTFGLAKAAHFTHPGAALTGRLVLDTIGLPRRLLLSGASGAALCASRVKELLPRRKPDAHKGTSGRVVVFGGSPGLSGAPRLCAAAALRAGAGLVTIAHPETITADMASRWPDIMTWPLPGGKEGGLYPGSLPALPGWLPQVQAMAVGPGLGATAEGERFVVELLERFAGSAVVDADALRACGDAQRVRRLNPGRLVLTPHPGEMARLCGVSVEEVQQDRVGVARRVAREWGAVTVLKGAGTVVAIPDGRYFINTTGNPGMAVGGSGDVLAGIIAGFMAQGLPPGDAAACGVFVHGLAGDLLAEERPRGFLAGELADQVPAAIRKVEAHDEHGGSNVFSSGMGRGLS